jgi:hypothetical protein
MEEVGRRYGVGGARAASFPSRTTCWVHRMIETIERPRVRRLRAARPPPDNEHFPYLNLRVGNELHYRLVFDF